MKKIVFRPASGCLFAALVLTGIILIALMFLRGGVWLGDKALPYFEWASRITLFVVLIILLPMAAFHKSRRQSEQRAEDLRAGGGIVRKGFEGVHY